jgi:hypothetical protein
VGRRNRFRRTERSGEQRAEDVELTAKCQKTWRLTAASSFGEEGLLHFRYLPSELRAAAGAGSDRVRTLIRQGGGSGGVAEGRQVPPAAAWKIAFRSAARRAA